VASPAGSQRTSACTTGEAASAALAEFLAAVRLPEGADVLGPVPEPPRPGQEGERERYLVRVRRTDGLALARALHEVQAVRSARKALEHVRVQLDPLELA
jgi:primosomal protein N' (replication factor Y)